jgi:tetratricopeptide (TPR) repeat protein
MLCEIAGDVRYAFVAPTAGLDPRSQASSALEPIGLVMACFLVGSQGERAARSLAPFEHATLTLDAERAKSLLPALQGPVRAVLEQLVLTPASVQSLRERGLVSSDELVASVCALWIARVLNVRGHAGSQTFPAVRPPSGAPRVSQAPTASVHPDLRPPSSSTPPAIASISSALPPRRDSGFVRAVHGALDAGGKEHAMEAKVEEAWMRAEADPARAQQITEVVRKAVSVFPKYPRMHYYLARLHIQANRVDEAMQEFEAVLALDPNDKQVAGELSELKARRAETGNKS